MMDKITIVILKVRGLVIRSSGFADRDWCSIKRRSMWMGFREGGRGSNRVGNTCGSRYKKGIGVEWEIGGV